MRAQPFHLGHKRLLLRLSELCTNGVVFLNTEQDTRRNPFPYKLRKIWIETFLETHGVNNIIVAERDINMKPEEKHREYRQQFGEENFIILTTNETEQLFKSLGFQTLNHQSSAIIAILWPRELGSDNLHGYGNLIRELLRRGGDCSAYLDPTVEKDAKEYLHSSSETN